MSAACAHMRCDLIVLLKNFIVVALRKFDTGKNRPWDQDEIAHKRVHAKTGGCSPLRTIQLGCL